MSNQHIKKYKYLIDFHGASHGHFLEYVINTWIYNGPRVPRVFTELGTSHLPKQNPDYQANCMIKCGHYTEYQVVQDPPEKIVRITVDTKVGQQIHMVNVMHRAGDITLETSYKLIPSDVLDMPALLRTNWFSKLTDAENLYKLDYKWRWPNTDAFEFPMKNLYDLTLFYQTLQRCADFLEQKFTPDQELYTTWQQFIDMNQGLQCYKKSKKIVELALANQDFEFDSNESEQALINAILTNTVNMYDGPLFNDNLYPTNTMQIWQCIQAHLKEFDNKY
jgi:hypothetical protein